MTENILRLKNCMQIICLNIIIVLTKRLIDIVRSNNGSATEALFE
jgi:hypothetical protein